MGRRRGRRTNSPNPRTQTAHLIEERTVPAPSLRRLRPTRSSPSASTRQRRPLRNAFLNAGFSATLSARALIIRLPVERFFAQYGTRPQCIGVISSGASLEIVGIVWVGAMLYRGGLSASKSSKSLTNGKALATSERRAKKEKRPHIDPSFWPGRRESPMLVLFLSIL